ncbi:MAG TPA: hypothetical protein PLB51_02250 [Candidatus Paceibacterota bacterium]|nr:hypothetical protein [Candidatus Paceibacterota bacterium]
MKHRSKDKEKAIELRKQGLSYKEIRQHVFVSKGLLSLWLSRLELTHEEKERLRVHTQERVQRGRVATLIANRSRRIERERVLIKGAEKLFKKWKNNPFFFVGLSLCLVGGVKKGYVFDFSAKEPEMVRLMVRWLKMFLFVEKKDIRFRMLANNNHNKAHLLAFWTKALGIEPSFLTFTMLKPSKSSLKKGLLDMGCVRVSVYGVNHVRTINAWQKLLIQYYDEAI